MENTVGDCRDNASAPTMPSNATAASASSAPAGPAGGGKASAATYGAIDSLEAGTPMWLARIPPKLARAWDNAPEGAVLGTLTFTKGSPAVGSSKNGAAKGAPPLNRPGSIQQSLTVRVPEAFAKVAPDLPLDYSAEAMTKKVPVLHPFSRRSDGSVALHGTVQRSCNLQMLRTGRYRQMCRNRLVQSVNTTRFVRSVDQVDLSVRTRPVAATARGGGTGFGESVHKFGKNMNDAKERAATDPTGRKRKFQDQPIRSVLFELFSSQKYWTVKELRNESGRAEKEIRPVLSELCEFHRSGEQKGAWELKTEFRSQEELGESHGGSGNL